jgi:NAD(P)-dependent dehydrogenase (short-subunit alcohol dehydrogenase family)
VRLEGRRAVLVGAATGIGRETAHLFAQEGASVVVADSNDVDGAATVAEITEGGGRAFFVRADATKPAEVEALMGSAAHAMGGIDVLVNNAGVLRSGVVTDFEEEDWDTVMNVNVKGCFLGSKYAVPYLRKGNRGAIVNMASTSGIKTGGGLTAYAASKGAVIAFTKSLAAELAEDQIRVNCICPGWIDTPFNQPAIDYIGGAVVRDDFVQRAVPLRRQGEPREIAEGIVFLASDASSYMTAQALIVDGGLV